jgi:hypothetical protein
MKIIRSPFYLVSLLAFLGGFLTAFSIVLLSVAVNFFAEISGSAYQYAETGKWDFSRAYCKAVLFQRITS